MKSLINNYIMDALLLIAAGLILLFRPSGTLEFFCTAFGIILLIMGVGKVLAYFLKKDPYEYRRSSFCVGILQIVAGIWLLVSPGFFIGFFPFVAGLVIAYGAVISLIEAISLRRLQVSGAGAATVMSLITLAMALVVIMHPAMITEIIVQVIGVALVVEGATLLLSLSRR